MKIRDIIESFELPVYEGGASGGARYNSEIAMLYAFAGTGNFDINNLESSFDTSKINNPEKALADIKRFLPDNYNEKLFNLWYNVSNNYMEKIKAHSGKAPAQFDWVGGDNAGPVADVGFIGHSSSGVSIKDAGGITLSNLTPKALGIDPERGSDVFANYAKEEFADMKTKIFNDLLNDAKASPNTRIAPASDKYAISYIANSNKFRVEGKKTIEATADEILGQVGNNAKWQRVFGDYFQKNFAAKKEYAAPLYKKIATIFEQLIEQKLSNSDALANVLKFEDVPYYYATPKKLFYVPSREAATNLKLKGIKYANPDGTSQKFLANIGQADTDDFATIDIYIRYANGMFETNPTVRVQSLKNPQHLGWDEL